jgi:hypothetical protein
VKREQALAHVILAFSVGTSQPIDAVASLARSSVNKMGNDAKGKSETRGIEDGEPMA